MCWDFIRYHIWHAVWVGAYISWGFAKSGNCNRIRKRQKGQRIHGERKVSPWWNCCHGTLLLVLNLTPFSLIPLWCLLWPLKIDNICICSLNRWNYNTKSTVAAIVNSVLVSSIQFSFFYLNKLKMVKQRLMQPDVEQNGWLLDGYPRSLSQAMALENLEIRPDIFILLEVWCFTLIYQSSCMHLS